MSMPKKHQKDALNLNIFDLSFKRLKNHLLDLAFSYFSYVYPGLLTSHHNSKYKRMWTCISFFYISDWTETKTQNVSVSTTHTSV